MTNPKPSLYETFLAFSTLPQMQMTSDDKLELPVMMHRKSREAFDLWHKQAITDRGLELLPLKRLRMEQEFSVVPGVTDKAGTLMLIRALDPAQDITQTYVEHVEKRLDDGGNLFTDWSGPTGLTKSSCSLFHGAESGLFDCHIKSKGDLEVRLAYKQWEIHRCFQAINARDMVFQDEIDLVAGQGSITDDLNYNNLQDQVRKSQKNLNRCSPTASSDRPLATRFEALAKTPNRVYEETGKGHTLFLGFEEDKPVGTMLYPWCGGQLYTWYEGIKDARVEAVQHMDKGGTERVLFMADQLLQSRPGLALAFKDTTQAEQRQILKIAGQGLNIDNATLENMGTILRLVLERARKTKRPGAGLDLLERVFDVSPSVTLADAAKIAATS